MKKVITILLMCMILSVGIVVAEHETNVPVGMTWEEYQDMIEDQYAPKGFLSIFNFLSTSYWETCIQFCWEFDIFGDCSVCPSGYTEVNCAWHPDQMSVFNPWTSASAYCSDWSAPNPDYNKQCYCVEEVITPPGEGECRYFDGVERCCDEAGHIFCDHDEPTVCGDPGYCANLNNPELSCIPGEDWCCYEVGWVADYTHHRCCPPDYPFYIGRGIYDDYCSMYDTLDANNYYTNLATCDYLYSYDTNQFTIEETCLDYNFKVCEMNRIAQWINGWDLRGIVLGKCGVECNTDANCPTDEVFGEKYCDGLNVVQQTKDYFCSGYKCIYAETPKVIEVCSYQCQNGVCVGCIENEIVQIEGEYYICRDGYHQRVLDLVEFTDAEQQELLDEINRLVLTIEEKAQLISELTLNLEQQGEIVNQLQISIDEKALIIQSLTSNIDEQNALISQLELNLEEKIQLVNSLELNIQEQAVTILALTSQAEEQAVIISNLNLNIQQQASLIDEMELTVAQQSIIINNLGLEISQQSQIIDNLNLNLQQKIELISQLEITTQEQVDLINQMTLSFSEQQEIINALDIVIENDVAQILALQLSLSESANYINDLEYTISQQADLISQLELTTQEQAILISQLQLNNEETAQLISNLNLQISEQAEIIRLLNLEIDDDAEIIANLNLQLSEEADLIDSLHLTISGQIELISQLELSIAEEKELVDQLSLTLEEKETIIEGLETEREKFDIHRLLFKIGEIRVTLLGFVLSLLGIVLMIFLISIFIKKSKRKK